MLVRAAHLAVIGAAGLILSTSAAAFDSTANAQGQPGTSAAPSKSEERICETITVTGSRLAKKKWCGTRAEWADKRLQDRQVVDQFQTNQCVFNKTDPHSGRPTC